MSSFARTAIAAVIAASLFGYIYFVESKKDPASVSSEGATPKTKVFPGLDKLKVTSFTLSKRNGDEVRAEKTGDSWTLVSPAKAPADGGEIGTILDALQNLEGEEVAHEEGADLEPFGLKEPRVKVSVTAEGAPQAFEFELGDDVPAGFSLFGRVPGRSGLFAVSSTVENTLSKSGFDLRDRNLLGVKRESIEAFEFVDKGRSVFKLARGAEGADDWKVEAPVATRAARWNADSLVGLIENLRMESIATDNATAQDLARYGLAASARRVVLSLKDSKTAVLEIGSKTADGKFYARVADSPQVATINAAVADDLDKGLKNLRATRLLDIAAYEVSGFDVVAGGAIKTFAKSSSKQEDGGEQIVWKSTPPVKDATAEKTSEALFAIGGTDASDFIDAPGSPAAYGLDVPALRVAIRFENGKKADWFELSVTEAAGFARRRNDSAILKLDKAKAEALIKSFTELGS